MVKTRCGREYGNSSIEKCQKWNRELTLMFCECCIEELEELGSYTPNSPFTFVNEYWPNVAANFNSKTGKSYDWSQLMSKWNALEQDWKLWNRFIQRETGLGWDPRSWKIFASDQWWEKKLQELPDAVKFKKKGVDLELIDLLDIMFTDATALADHTFIVDAAPTEGWGDSDGDLLMNTELKFEVESDELKAFGQGKLVNLVVVHAKREKQAEKPVDRGTTELSFKVDRFCDKNYGRRNTATSHMAIEVLLKLLQ